MLRIPKRVFLIACVAAAMLPYATTQAEWRILTLEAESHYDRFGTTVAAPGDVNGDGWPDLFVGAGVSDAGNTDAGRAYVFYGGPEADEIPDLIFTGEAYQDRFAIWVSAPGDVNGDGYADLLTGAPFQDAGGDDAGASYLFFGGPEADQNRSLKSVGEEPGDQFGFATGGAGDFNADGYDDWIVGSFLHSSRLLEAGRAYIFFGGPDPDNVPDLVLEGEFALDRFGSAVTGVGDLNGDGYDDIAVGAYQADEGGNDSGAVYLYFGGPSPDTEADLILAGRDELDQFGWSVTAAGDLDGDGHDDLVVGAILADDGVDFGGAAYVYFGGPDLDTVSDFTLVGEVAFDQLGNAAAGLGDVNGDGYDDLLIGARDADFNGPQSGRAYLFHGGPEMDAEPDLVLTGDSENDRFGYAVAGPGDVDGDGHCDLLIGARMADAVYRDAGRSYLISAAAYRLRDPNGGEVWTAGDKVSVRWNGRGVADLDLSLDSGWTWSTITQFVGGGDESVHTLTVPEAVTDMALLRVRSTGSESTGLNEDRSDAVFSIALPVEGRFSVWPMPSRDGAVTIEYRAAGWLGSATAKVNLAVYDISGRRLRTVMDGAISAGIHRTSWNGRDEDGRPVPSGIYLLRLQTGGWDLEREITIVR